MFVPPPRDRQLTGGLAGRGLHHLVLLLAALAIAAILIGLLSRSAAGQELLQPGEAYVTRFSSATTQDGLKR